MHAFSGSDTVFFESLDLVPGRRGSRVWQRDGRTERHTSYIKCCASIRCAGNIRTQRIEQLAGVRTLVTKGVVVDVVLTLHSCTAEALGERQFLYHSEPPETWLLRISLSPEPISTAVR